MDTAPRIALMNWLTGQGLTGSPESDLIRGFCERCLGMGIELSRGQVFLDTLHPLFEGRGFRWSDMPTNESEMFEYGSTATGDAAESWRRSVFFHMLEEGHDEMRLDLFDPAVSERYNMIQSLRDSGHRHGAVFVHRFGEQGSMGNMDCVYSHWTTRREAGFDEDQMAALREVVPLLGLALKSAAQMEIARTLGRVYLGRDAAEQVLRGRITRGVTERIKAVLWFSDLRNSTGISEAIGPDEIIPFLNDYAEASINAIHESGGDVLKLIGDGVLAMFAGDDISQAKRNALHAEHRFRKNIIALNAKRSAASQPVTTAYVGLHIGQVFYGNIGSDDRLDFTVVGPAVNEVSRIASMCSSVDRPLLTSSEFQSRLDSDGRKYLVSTGRYALRGIGHAQDLYTLDPQIGTDEVMRGTYERYLAR